MQISCAYCSTKIEFNKKGRIKETCPFCEANLEDLHLNTLKICQNEKRFEFHKIQNNVFLDQANQSVKVLKKFHTFDLYLLLKEVRQARSQKFTVLRIINKASKQNKQFNNIAIEIGNDYEYYTRKAWAIENILLEKQSYFPEKITEKSLDFLWLQINQKKKSCKYLQLFKNERSSKYI
ncbi:hypothetical protein [Bacillus thuringiensis]|uniref:hypothetical protein n=1 Tax=Bacillus thuringiensis TaxID=1428 RepID=UPI003B984385